MDIPGSKVELRAFTNDIITKLYKWHMDPWFDDVMSNEIGPKTEVDIKNMYNNFMPPNGRLFAIYNKKADKCIGIVALFNIDLKNRAAEIFGGIGEKKDRDKGLGPEALRLMMNWGINQLGLQRIYAHAKAHNQQSINLLKKAGFTSESVVKDSIYQNGKFINKVLLGYTLSSKLPLNIMEQISSFSMEYTKESGKKLHEGYLNVLNAFCEYVRKQHEGGD